MNEFDYKGWVGGNLVSEAPESSTSPGTKNQMYIDEDCIYVCVDTDKWKKVALSDF